ncbi:MAG: hypothetical protein ACRD1E_09530, partial [Terriglobales bacterium]
MLVQVAGAEANDFPARAQADRIRAFQDAIAASPTSDQGDGSPEYSRALFELKAVLEQEAITALARPGSAPTDLAAARTLASQADVPKAIVYFPLIVSALRTRGVAAALDLEIACERSGSFPYAGALAIAQDGRATVETREEIIGRGIQELAASDFQGPASAVVAEISFVLAASKLAPALADQVGDAIASALDRVSSSPPGESDFR